MIIKTGKGGLYYRMKKQKSAIFINLTVIMVYGYVKTAYF